MTVVQPEDLEEYKGTGIFAPNVGTDWGVLMFLWGILTSATCSHISDLTHLFENVFNGPHTAASSFPSQQGMFEVMLKTLCILSYFILITMTKW